ncbi:hypothetical protein M409DRAFT_53516 [Zasmidium cellare ATCC 36951]|uniref:Uncharacterized protein n=1 Tax=Zasmidium cellare ATCC 36951 TaxID=1080233 RepID=A0A6A6CLW3_ZASCE|nr:uncharacterized protein M409DRAFT_53516 [Zasmidium cellare ATCC 36951]KAF2168217.1 hypothetical protein M409DRAFT_53516 [Zasmidium cellare ATCC 36951]
MRTTCSLAIPTEKCVLDENEGQCGERADAMGIERDILDRATCNIGNLPPRLPVSLSSQHSFLASSSNPLFLLQNINILHLSHRTLSESASARKGEEEPARDDVPGRQQQHHVLE